MAEVLPSAYAAEAAVGTVVGTFLIRHPEVAYRAVIFAELHLTVVTEVSAWNKEEGYEKISHRYKEA